MYNNVEKISSEDLIHVMDGWCFKFIVVVT